MESSEVGRLGAACECEWSGWRHIPMVACCFVQRCAACALMCLPVCLAAVLLPAGLHGACPAVPWGAHPASCHARRHALLHVTVPQCPALAVFAVNPLACCCRINFAAVSEQTGDSCDTCACRGSQPLLPHATAAPSIIFVAVSEQTGDYVLVERDDVVKALASFIAEYIGALHRSRHLV